VIHLVNWSYGSARDRVEPLRDVSLVVDLRALGVPGARTARILQPGRPVSQVEVDEGRVRLPELGLWALLVLGGSSYTVVATR
jgi:hypothetical protein